MMCVSFFVPDEVLARENHIYNNIEVDYRFLPTDKDNKSEFKLYDITGSLYFESQYDEESGNYYFYNDEKKYYECRAGFCGQSYNDYETSFRDYIKYSDELITISDKDYFLNFINTNHLHGSYIYDNRHCCGNHYDKYNYYD